MIVMKFGGTSTQDAAAMANVAHIVKAHLAKQPIVVISAIAGATNALETIGGSAADQKIGESQNVIDELLGRHLRIVDTLIKDRSRNSELQGVLANARRDLEELVRGVSILRELTPRTLDAFYAYGELLSSRLIAAVLQEERVDTVWIDTKEFMITDDHHNRALPLMESVETRLQALAFPLMKQDKVLVTQGYIGVTSTGRRTTMGRESSDYSAAVIGAALGVEDIQIWTDVDGILTADPRIVEAPMKVKQLSFEEAYELSFFGAKVLHPNTMLPAIEKNIPIHIYNSRHPQRSGTKVTVSGPEGDPVVKSVAYKKNMVLLSVRPKKRYGQFGFWEHLYNILTEYGAMPGMTVTSEFSIAFAIDAKSNLPAIVHEMNAIGHVELAENKAILCLVGSNIKSSRQLMARLLHAMGTAGVDMVSFGASRSNVSIVLDETQVLDAVRRVHEEFFGSRQDGTMFESLKTESMAMTVA